MKHTLAELQKKISELQVKAMDKALTLLSVIENLPQMVRDDLEKRNFDMIFSGYVHGQLLGLLQENNFNTAGIIGTYVSKVNYHVVIGDDMGWYMEYDDKGFDRSHVVETKYTTANGKSVIKKIKSGKIIDMIDKGRDNFQITARNGTVVKRNGKRYRWLVYRAKARDTNDWNYYKSNNYEIYNPKKKDQRIRLVPDKTTITVNGSTYSTFGLDIYKRIREYANDNDIYMHIIHESMDDYIVRFIRNKTTDIFNELKNSVYELVKYIKLYNTERNRNR